MEGWGLMKTAFIVFDRMTSLDFIGLYDPVTRLQSMKIMNEFEWRICAMAQSVVDDRGLRMKANIVAKSLDCYDMVFVPGGYGTRTLRHDHEFIDWLKTAGSAWLKVSVCTGALLLGAAGFLRGRRATTHPSAYQELEPYCRSVIHDRVVDEGEVVTSSGVSAAIDLGLYIVQKLAGEEARTRIATQMDYPCQWSP
ncbi:MAG: putative transcription regulator, AraC family protein [Nitrospira sp.]